MLCLVEVHPSWLQKHKDEAQKAGRYGDQSLYQGTLEEYLHRQPLTFVLATSDRLENKLGIVLSWPRQLAS